MKLARVLASFFRTEDGLETVEYAIMAALITAVAIATIASVGFWVNARFEAFESVLTTAPGTGG